MSKEIIFKKNVFGGFDRRQVIEYISYLTSHCPDSASRKEILKLRKQIEELEGLINQRDAVISDLKSQKTSDSMNPVIISLQEIVQNGKKLKKSNEEIDAVTSSIQKDIDAKQPKIDSLLSKIASINSEFQSIQSNLRAIALKLSEIDFDNIGHSENPVTTDAVKQTVKYETISDEAKEEVDTAVQIISNTDEYDYPADDDNDYTPMIFDNTDDNSDVLINSIDNFFIELEKIAEAQIFDLTTLLDNEDNDNATE